MADNEAEILCEIQDKYVPFLKKLIAFLEKTKKATPDNLNRLKSIHSVFTTASIPQQIEVFNTNKKKLEKWFKNGSGSQKDKIDDDGSSADGPSTRASKRTLIVEDTDSSQGASENNAAKKIKASESENSAGKSAGTFNPALIAQMKKEKADAPKVVQPTLPVISAVLNPAPAVPAASTSSSSTSNDDGPIVFTCASCQFQTLDEAEFMKHTRTDHRSDLSMWCKQCGKCFSNAGVLVSHIKEKACAKEEMIYRCGVKDCTFETTSGQTFVHHLRHCHKGSPFIFCVHCQKIFTLPHCLILHMQDDCPFKERNRRNPGSMPPAADKSTVATVTKPPTIMPRPQGPSFLPRTPTIASVTSASSLRPTTPVIRAPALTPRGRGALMPTARGRGRGRGKGGRGRPPSESSDSDDPDDPSWKPEEIAGQPMLRRSGRWAKKVNDVVNVEPKPTSKGLSSAELSSAKEMLRCPCCDFMAAFKSVLQDHYIAHHKVPNKNACLVCHLKFESTQCFLDHFEDHINGKLPNKQVIEVAANTPKVSTAVKAVASPITVQEDSSKSDSNSGQSSEVLSLDKELIRGVVRNISEANIVNPTSADAKFVKIPYQAAIHDKNSKDSKLKKFEELKSPNDLIAMRSANKLKCFYKCVMYGCPFTANDSDEYFIHLDTSHKGKRMHCSYCLKEFFSAEVLTHHMMAEHSKRHYQCSNCFYRACSKAHVQVHIKNYHANDTTTEVLTCDPINIAANVTVNEPPTEIHTTWPYICAIGDCNFQSFDPKEFQSHNELTHRTVSVFFCHYCKVDFISFKRLLNHYRLHGINAFQCNYCIHGSETSDEIFLHLCNAHADQQLIAFMRGSDEDASSKASPHPFSLCSENVGKFNMGSARPESPSVEKTHPNIEMQQYEVVGETYYPKYLGSMGSDFICGIPYCQEKFENMLPYIGHLRNAHAAVNFSCPHCPQVSETWENFKTHLLCHGPELYACGLVTCNFYDWDKDVVTEHLKTHSQTAAKVVIVRELPSEDNDTSTIKSLPQVCPFKVDGEYYLCFFCRYKSSEKNVMKNHLYNEVMYKRFCCSSCDEKCVSRKEMKEHYINQHSDQEIKCSVHPNPTIENAVKQLLNQKIELSELKVGQCGSCSKGFKSTVTLQRHISLCTRNQYQPYDCKYCKCSFSDIKILKFHSDEKHFRKPLMFSEVSSSLVEDELGQKLQHVRLKYLHDAIGKEKSTNDTPPICFVKFYVCNICSFESNQKYNTQTHIENSHKDVSAEISKVLRNVNMPDLSNSQFEDTLDTTPVSLSKIKRYRCGFCIKKLHSLEELEQHVESLHPVREEVKYMFYYSPDSKASFPSDDKEIYECSYCKSGKGNLNALKTHSDLMHSESPFKVRGFVIRNREQESVLACGYCYCRVDGTTDLKKHIASDHPSLPLKSVGGFKGVSLKRALEDSDDFPNKRVKFGALVFVCSHCGAAYSSQEQVATHSKKSHTRLQLQFTTVSVKENEDMKYYKCEFCQFTSEQEYLDMHLKTKHKNRVTCGYCNKRFEFASKLREHHDGVHKGMPVKYSQETLPFIKKEPKDPNTNSVSPLPTVSSKKEIRSKTIPRGGSSKKKQPETTDLNSLFIHTGTISECPSRLSVFTFSKIYQIFPKVVLTDVMKEKK